MKQMTLCCLHWWRLKKCHIWLSLVSNGMLVLYHEQAACPGMRSCWGPVHFSEQPWQLQEGDVSLPKFQALQSGLLYLTWATISTIKHQTSQILLTCKSFLKHMLLNRFPAKLVQLPTLLWFVWGTQAAPDYLENQLTHRCGTEWSLPGHTLLAQATSATVFFALLWLPVW